MAETQSAPSLRELSEAAPKGPWAVRPQELDDWGFVRGPVNEDGFRPVIFIARCYGDEAEQRAARAERRQPRQTEAISAFLCRLENDYRAGRLIDPTTLTEAVAAARAEGVREGLERAAGVAECLTDAIDDLRVIRDLHNVTACLERYETTLAIYRALIPAPAKLQLITTETPTRLGDAPQSGFVARNCACCADQPNIPPDCPACHGAGGFTRYHLATPRPAAVAHVPDAGEKSARALTRELRDIIMSDVRAASGSGAFPGETVGISAGNLSVILAVRLGCHFAALSAPPTTPGDRTDG